MTKRERADRIAARVPRVEVRVNRGMLEDLQAEARRDPQLVESGVAERPHELLELAMMTLEDELRAERRERQRRGEG